MTRALPLVIVTLRSIVDSISFMFLILSLALSFSPLLHDSGLNPGVLARSSTLFWFGFRHLPCNGLSLYLYLPSLVYSQQ